MLLQSLVVFWLSSSRIPMDKHHFVVWRSGTVSTSHQDQKELNGYAMIETKASGKYRDSLFVVKKTYMFSLILAHTFFSVIRVTHSYKVTLRHGHWLSVLAP